MKPEAQENSDLLLLYKKYESSSSSRVLPTTLEVLKAVRLAAPGAWKSGTPSDCPADRRTQACSTRSECQNAPTLPHPTPFPVCSLCSSPRVEHSSRISYRRMHGAGSASTHGMRRSIVLQGFSTTTRGHPNYEACYMHFILHTSSILQHASSPGPREHHECQIDVDCFWSWWQHALYWALQDCGRACALVDENLPLE